MSLSKTLANPVGTAAGRRPPSSRVLRLLTQFSSCVACSCSGGMPQPEVSAASSGSGEMDSVHAATTQSGPRDREAREGAAPSSPAAADNAAAQLWERLRTLTSPDVLALGHEDSTAYGVGWDGDAGRSDVKSICGDYPAVHGWDIGKLGSETNLDGVPFAVIRRRIVEAHERGGINTVSWHMDNYVSGGDSWDTTKAVAALLPGGSHHADYLERLTHAADFFSSLVDSSGEIVPLVFRPFHEQMGWWFWWGAFHSTSDDYISLFRFTVQHLRHALAQRQLLIAFSPNARGVRSEAQYLERYPGDDVIDVLGLDMYYGNEGADQLVAATEVAVAIAERRGKVAAITEFGVTDGLSNEQVQLDTWFTERFLQPLKQSPMARRAAFALTWRNASEAHHFAPYPGHPAAPNFADMCADSFVLLERDLSPPSSVRP